MDKDHLVKIFKFFKTMGEFKEISLFFQQSNVSERKLDTDVLMS